MATSLNLLKDPVPEDNSLPAFMVSTARGFLPRAHPIMTLPSAFAPLESILVRMPIQTAAGTPGLLASFQLGDVVHRELPNLSDCITPVATNLPLINALYRDYCFLAAAYLLEPCHERFLKGEQYGLGRQVLPTVIAKPLVRCAEITGFMPWMEYAGAYALYNYRLHDPSAPMEYSNLRLIRAFERGHDPTSSEAGFVLVHVEMARHSGLLVHGAAGCLEACEQASLSTSLAASHAARSDLNANMRQILGAMQRINAAMETMWNRSRPTSYTSFRTFIFGITAQSMFPDGVVYDGVNENKPMSFRGESGANDSTIPLMDHLLQVTMPDTPLTQILRDFHEYRPSNHRAFLTAVRTCSAQLRLKEFALATSPPSLMHPDDPAAVTESRQLWLLLLDQVREFRWRHWCFAREYILKQTSHPTATGGSPIVTWLPNQLGAVLDEMAGVHQHIRELEGNRSDLGTMIREVMERVERQRERLDKEVAKYCEDRGIKQEK